MKKLEWLRQLWREHPKLIKAWVKAGVKNIFLANVFLGLVVFEIFHFPQSFFRDDILDFWLPFFGYGLPASIVPGMLAVLVLGYWSVSALDKRRLRASTLALRGALLGALAGGMATFLGLSMLGDPFEVFTSAKLAYGVSLALAVIIPIASVAGAFTGSNIAKVTSDTLEPD